MPILSSLGRKNPPASLDERWNRCPVDALAMATDCVSSYSSRNAVRHCLRGCQGGCAASEVRTRRPLWTRPADCQVNGMSGPGHGNGGRAVPQPSYRQSGTAPVAHDPAVAEQDSAAIGVLNRKRFIRLQAPFSFRRLLESIDRAVRHRQRLLKPPELPHPGCVIGVEAPELPAQEGEPDPVSEKDRSRSSEIRISRAKSGRN